MVKENFRLKKLKIILFFLALILAGIFARYAVTIYSKSDSCFGIDGPFNTVEQRQRVLKKFLALKVRETINQNNNGAQYKMAIIPKRIDDADIVELIKSESILDLVKEPIIYINEESAIGNLGAKTLQNDFSIIRYSRLQREMEIIPAYEIQPENNEATKDFFSGENKNKFELTWMEKLRGYGNALYKIKTVFIDLACCDNLGNKNGKRPSWYARKNIDLIEWKSLNVKKHLVFSNCGELLSRNYEGTVIYLF